MYKSDAKFGTPVNGVQMYLCHLAIFGKAQSLTTIGTIGGKRDVQGTIGRRMLCPALHARVAALAAALWHKLSGRLKTRRTKTRHFVCMY